jgi:hypothetical protein
LADLDRSNLGNARLQGLPGDVLGGDPTGVLFDWVNSAFFFTYVSFRFCWILAASQLLTTRLTDTFANSVHGPLEVLQSTRMDWLLCYLLGDIFHINGMRTLQSLFS